MQPCACTAILLWGLPMLCMLALDWHAVTALRALLMLSAVFMMLTAGITGAAAICASVSGPALKCLLAGGLSVDPLTDQPNVGCVRRWTT